MEEKLYFNGRVFTGTGENDFADAFKVKDGVFTWVGRLDGGAPAGAVDLGGRFVLPGLIEAHIHSILVALASKSVACTIPVVRSIPDLIAALKGHPNLGKGDDLWITGWGYDESKLAENRTPTRHDLDQVSTTQPIYVIRSDCHSGICNTKALELAGVTRDTPDPEVGWFGRDPDGEPNGVLFELEANARVRNLAERPDFESVVEGIVNSAKHFRERGYAVTTEMMARLSPLNHIEAFREAEMRGFDLQTALYLVWERGMRDLLPEEKTGRVRVSGIKLFADGSVSARTAWVNEPYKDGTCGIPTTTREDIRDAVVYAKRNGLQMSFHVMGDRSIDLILDALEGEEAWLTDVPSVRLEHVTLITPEHLKRMKASRVNFGLTTQVIFPFAEYESYVESLEPGVFKRAYPVKMLEAEPIPFALSSDSPATTWMDPDDMTVSLEAAVTRTAYNGKSINSEQAISVGKALTLYTGRAAPLFAKEVPAGVIGEGYEANFNIMNFDPFGAEPSTLHTLRVMEAFARGKSVYRREQD